MVKPGAASDGGSKSSIGPHPCRRFGIFKALSAVYVERRHIIGGAYNDDFMVQSWITSLYSCRP